MLNNKIIVVIGGAGLLGKSFSLEVAKQGAKVIVADINFELACLVAKEIEGAGFFAEPMSLDITKADSIESFIDCISNKYGRIDGVVNNAYPRNRSWGRELREVTYDDFCENTNLHLGGYFLTTQKFSFYLQSIGGGSIVNIASIYGTSAPKFDIYPDKMTMPVEYAAIKAGIIHLSKYFAQYFKKYGVRCNTLSPGGIFDNQSSEFISRYSSHCGVKGMLSPVDVAGSLIFLLSDNSLHLNGQNIVVDDGFTL